MRYKIKSRLLYSLIFAIELCNAPLVSAADQQDASIQEGAAAERPRVVWPLPDSIPDPIPLPANVSTPEPPLSLMTERFSINAGIFSGSITSGGNQDNKTPFSGEQTFGLSGRTSVFPNLQIKFRVADRLNFGFSYLRVDRMGGVTNTYPDYFVDDLKDYFGHTQSVESSQMEWRVLRGSLAFDFLRGDRYKVAGLFGLQYDQAFFALQTPIPALVPQAPYFRRIVWGMTDVLPTIGVEAIFMLDASKRWSVLLRNEQIKTAKTVHADLQYRWRPNISAGLGYTNFSNSMKAGAAPASSMELNFAVSGPELFLRYSY